MNFNKLTFGILASITLTVSSLLALLHLSEWLGIQILQRTEDYPFGGEGPSAYYYQTAELYSTTMLIWGILFLIAFVYGLWKLKERQTTKMMKPFVLTLLLFVIMLLSGFVK